MIKITKHNRDIADKVLLEIEKFHDTNSNHDVQLEMYDYGFEHGYYLVVPNKVWASFSEASNCKKIRVRHDAKDWNGKLSNSHERIDFDISDFVSVSKYVLNLMEGAYK